MTIRSSDLSRPVRLLLLAAVAGAAACGPRTPASPAGAGRGSADARAAPVPVTLVPVRRRSVDRTVDLTGTLLGQEQAAISAKVSGRIAAIEHDLGDIVPDAGVLARIDPRDLELALAERRAAASAALARLGLTQMPGDDVDLATLPTVRRARAEAANAEARFDRAARLFEQQPPLISAQDFADIQTARDVARNQAEVELLTVHADLADARAQAAAAEIAEQRLRDAVIQAPPGRRYRVAERMVSIGEYVAEGRELFRLVDSEIVKLRAQAPERFAGAIRPGQAALVSTESSGGPAAGRVARVSPAVDPASRTFAIEIEIDNSAGLFKPGAFARARVVTRTEEGVTLVPAAAVTSFAGVDRVYSVEAGKAVEHRVRLGQREGDHVEIVGGLQPEHIIAQAPPTLSPGAAVSVSAEPAAPR